MLYLVPKKGVKMCISAAGETCKRRKYQVGDIADCPIAGGDGEGGAKIRKIELG